MQASERTTPLLAAMVGGAGVDGATNGPADPKTSWQQAEALGLVEQTGAGVGFYNAPDDLLAAAGRSALGGLVLRFDWARIEPEEDRRDPAALDRWVEIARRARTEGLCVHAVLSDGVLPAWFGPEGWLLPATAERFASVAGWVAAEMDDLLDGIVTVEAPARWSAAGWLLGVAPPFRTGAARDGLAALDGLLSAHCLADAAIEVEAPHLDRSMIPSGGLLGDLEAALLGAPGVALPRAVAGWVEDLGPGRASQLADRSDQPWGSAAWAVVGRGAGSARPTAARILEAGSGPRSFAADDVVSAIELAGSRVRSKKVHVAWRRQVATIDQAGRRAILPEASISGHLACLLEAIGTCRARGIIVDRLVVGELVDRWVLGSYSSREGLIGVDRLRGDRGFRLLSTDAAGQDALGALGAAEALAER
jgi:hypothetical protein